MRQTLARLLRLSAIYAIGDILSRGASLLLLPLYTATLSPADYGVLGVSEMLRQVLQMLLSLGTAGAVLRFYTNAPDEENRKRLFGTLWLLLVVGPGLVCLALLSVGRPLFDLLFAQIEIDRYLPQVIANTFLTTAFLMLPPGIFRAREQAGRYIAFNLGLFAVTNLAIIWQVVFLGRGAEGYLTGQLVGTGALAVISAALLLPEVSLRPAWQLLGPVLAYSLPLVPHFIAHWALGLSDRLILERHVPLADLGVYTLAYQIGNIGQMLVGAVSNALLPMFGRAAADASEWRRLPQVVTYTVLGNAAAILGLILVAPSLVQLATPTAYHSAGQVALPILLGYLVFGLYMMPMNALAQTAGRTRMVPLLTMTAAGVNIGLNLLLVPQYGIWAAAVTSLVGYVTLLVLVWVTAQRARPLPYEYGRIGKIMLAMLATLTAGMAALRYEPLLNLALAPLVLLILPALLGVLGFWSARERALISGMWTKIIPRRS